MHKLLKEKDSVEMESLYIVTPLAHTSPRCNKCRSDGKFVPKLPSSGANDRSQIRPLDPAVPGRPPETCSVSQVPTFERRAIQLNQLAVELTSNFVLYADLAGNGVFCALNTGNGVLCASNTLKL